jgi:hypothetical protein
MLALTLFKHPGSRLYEFRERDEAQPSSSLAKEVRLHPPIKTSRQVRHFNLSPSHQTFDVPDVLVAKLRPVAKGRYTVPVYSVTLTGWGLCNAWDRGW